MPAKRALIVDDSTTAQYRLKKMLRPYGLHIDVMDSGEAALRYLATNEPDVIFMDHLMPGMDGFRVLQIIKSHPETATIPVIMYTSKSGDVYTGQARALGALDVVSKDTINAADLSRVMQTIHIYRNDVVPPEAISPEEPEVISQHEAKPIVDVEQEPIIDRDIIPVKPRSEVEPLADRRAPSPASVEQARNLELRLSHLEHTLEDSRRFITARVVREMQGLRKSLKKELSEAITGKPAPQETPVVSEPPPPVSSGSGWAVLSFFLLLIVLGLTVFYANRFEDYVAQAKDEQNQVNAQLKSMVVLAQSPAQKPVVQPVSSMAQPVQVPSAPKTPAVSYLADVAWTFNQTANIQFNQNNMDPKVAIRLHELLSRVIANGFKGNVLINIYTGNFCLAIDSQGQSQLPPPAMTLANCVLASEVYGLEQLGKRYSNDIEAVLLGLSPQEKDAVNIVINTAVGNYPYPDRQQGTIKDWNAAAQANNRLELRLELPGPPK